MNETSSFFGNDWLGAFLIIALLFGGNGGFFGGNHPQYATVNDVNAAVNNPHNIQNSNNIYLNYDI